MVLLEGRDLIIMKDPEDPENLEKAEYLLSVPRIKKRLAHRETKTRRISSFTGRMLKDFIDQNSQLKPTPLTIDLLCFQIYQTQRVAMGIIHHPLGNYMPRFSSNPP